MFKSILAFAVLSITFPHAGQDAALAVPADRSPIPANDPGPKTVPSKTPDAQTSAPAKNGPDAIASENPCFAATPRSRAAGLIGIAPDGIGTTAHTRDCAVLAGTRSAAQVGRAIEISDGARGPISGPGTSTADSASYALSLVNVRPHWPRSDLTGEANGLSVFVRQAQGDAAAILANIGVRSGFAAVLESYTFAADRQGTPTRAVRTQLGVVNPRDGGEFGLLLQAAEGNELAAGLRITSMGTATWKNYLEAVGPTGESIAYIRGSDGAFIGSDLAPTTDLKRNIGTPENRYATTYTQVLQLAESSFSDLPKCGRGEGVGALALIADAREPAKTWGQIFKAGGGRYKSFVKCDGDNWVAF